MRINRKHLLTTLPLTALFALSACSGGSTHSSSSPAASTSPEASSTPAPIKEATTLNPRIALTYDGGIMTVDGRTMELLNTIEKDGFLRLSPAGDNRHMTVADGSSYTILDMGTWEQPHGDHAHIYSTEPTLSALTFASDHTSHVIADHGKTAMFSDGTGSFEIYNPAQLTGADNRTATSLETSTVKLPAPHHGFAIPLDHDRYMVAVGSDKQRTGAAIVDANGTTILENNDCPGIHGEALAADGVISVGCQDGALIYKDGTFTKVTNPEDPYSRSGNQAGSPHSSVVLADYKIDKEAELERPEQFSLIDTQTEIRQKVQLPEGISYTFRSLARGPHGEALLLTTDGKLRFFNPNTGQELGSIDLMNAWEESTVWQDPRPALWVNDDVAYVSDPASSRLIGVSLKNIAEGTASVFAELKLPHTPNEINGVTGKAIDSAHEADHH